MSEKYITCSVRFPPDYFLEFFVDFLTKARNISYHDKLSDAIKAGAFYCHDTIITVVE